MAASNEGVVIVGVRRTWRISSGRPDDRMNAGMVIAFLCVLVLVAGSLMRLSAETRAQPFHVVVLAEPGGLHAPFVEEAKHWLQREAEVDNFTVEYLQDTERIDAALLAHTQLVIQLNFPPYHWTPTAQKAFVDYIDNGKGGWIGFHHASLLGEFDGYPMWPWFSDFLGGIRWKDYIRDFATAAVHVEAPTHPVMRGLPATFTVENEEWYTWDKSPRPHVEVLASVDEKSYTPERPIKMGDHPVVWTNPSKKARNVYIFMGHHPELFRNDSFTTMFHNAIVWAHQQ